MPTGGQLKEGKGDSGKNRGATEITEERLYPVAQRANWQLGDMIRICNFGRHGRIKKDKKWGGVRSISNGRQEDVKESLRYS